MPGRWQHMLIFWMASILLGCGALTPVRRPMQLRLEADQYGLGATSMQQLCDPGLCYVGQQVYLDESDVRGAMLQEGEAQGSLVLEFTEDGARKLKLVTRSNNGRRLAVVQDGKVLALFMIREEIAGGKAELSGKPTDLRRIFESLTEPARQPPAP